MEESFNSKFDHGPTHGAFCPGRVNIIGEHIDYHGFAVLPMALELGVEVVFRPVAEGLQLANRSANYEDYKLAVLSPSLVVDNSTPKWYNYFLAGVKGVLEEFNVDSPMGMQCLVDGDVPAGSGLSSSSALVCCGAIAACLTNRLPIDRANLADLCAKSERYVGTQGGGMDQAISMLAEAGQAKLIEFNPLVAHKVLLPTGCCFVVAHCGVSMNKAATHHFNLRVIEGRLGCQLVAKQLGVDDWVSCLRFKQLMTSKSLSFDQLKNAIKSTFGEGAGQDREDDGVLSFNKVLGRMNASEAEFLEWTAKTAATLVGMEKLRSHTYRIRDRANHVVGEAERVYLFRDQCQKLVGCSDAAAIKSTLQSLGRLMNESHESCSKLYDCSCDELDWLARTCVDNGALGARLTGAGWGGCAVALINFNEATEFIGKVKEAFQRKFGAEKAANFMIFPSQPAAGASFEEICH